MISKANLHDNPCRRPLRSEHPEVGFTQYEVVNTSEYCGKIIVQKKNTTTPPHSHKKKHETFLVWSGRFRMIVGGREILMRPGDVLSIDRGTVHEFTALEEDGVLLEFSTPSSPRDSYFTDKMMWGRVNHRDNQSADYPWPF
jgi:quercetin dioxygenase-like cupin family protein